MSDRRNTRQFEIVAILLIVTYFAHMLGQVVQIGGAQLAPSIVVYTTIAFLLARSAPWVVLVVGLVVGLLTMLATSSPYPLANIFAHGGGFLFASYLARMWMAQGKKLGVGSLVSALSLTTVVSWTVFAGVTWLALNGTEFAARSWDRFGIAFGEGFVGWWLYGFLGVAVPSLVVGIILSPALLRLVGRPGDEGAGTDQGISS